MDSHQPPAPSPYHATKQSVQVLTIGLAHHESPICAHLALFTRVKNASELLGRLRAMDAAFEYAFVDARTLLSTSHLLAAVFRAVHDATRNRLKTHNVHAEIVLCMSASNSIGDSFRRFGVTEATTDLAVVKVGGLGDCGGGETGGLDAQDVADHLGQHVDGESVAFCDSSIAPMTDLSLIRKIYKLNPTPLKWQPVTTDPSADRQQQQQQQELVDATPPATTAVLESVIVGMMALRGA